MEGETKDADRGKACRMCQLPRRDHTDEEKAECDAAYAHEGSRWEAWYESAAGHADRRA